MAVSVQMPKQGNTVEECLLVEWKVKEGNSVKTGDVLCSIETDKAAFDVPSTADGVVLRLLAKQGDLVPVLADIVILGEAGEKVDAAAPASPAPTAPAAAKTPEAAQPAAQPATPAATAPAPVQAGSGGQAVSPRARNLAAKLGVDASSMHGSGPGGRITSRDVQKQVDSGATPRATPLAKNAMAETGMVPGTATGIGGMARARDLIEVAVETGSVKRQPVEEEAPEIIPFAGIRKLIGDRMLQSLQEHAQLTLNSSADASELMALRAAVKENAETRGLPKITLNDMICWVVARTLPLFPEVNAVFDRKSATVARQRRAHLGVAIDTPRGLMVPVVADAHRMSLAELSAAIAGYAADARTGSILPDLLSGGTFTVTNLGALGVESFTPILNSPQVAILGVCAIVDTPARTPEGGFSFQPRMGLSLTIDHQVVDGAPGARFLQAVVKGLENIRSDLALTGAMSL